MKKRTACFLLLVLIMGVFSAFAVTIWQSASQEKDKTAEVATQQPRATEKAVQDQAQAPPDKISAGPQNIRERTAVFVFVGWLWAAIFVLICITRLEIKEADRLLDLKFYSDGKK
jgi:hypothetical protein